MKKTLTPDLHEELLHILQTRFEKHKDRHKDMEWKAVEAKLQKSMEKLWSLHQMETTGGEPDVVGFDKKTGDYIFFDCSPESPKGRRSLCYDQQALDARKENKPKDSAVNAAAAMGIELLTEEQYMELQQLGKFDTKTSSWIYTPEEVRKLGGGISAEFRFGRTFVFANGADSYFAARGFRGVLKV